MNRFNLVFLLMLNVVIAAFFSSCSKSDDGLEGVEMVFSDRTIALSQLEQEGFVTVTCNYDWSASSSSEWCSLIVISGEAGSETKVTFSVAANSAPDDRTATIRFAAGDYTDSVIIVQSHCQVLNVETDTVNIIAEGEIFAIKVDKTDDYTIDISNDWIVQTTENSIKTLSTDQLFFSVGSNVSTSERVSTITFSLGAIERKVTVVQSGLVVPDPDMTGMESDALTLAGKIFLGWNLGNSLEACSSTASAGETLWGNPKTTRELIDSVKAAGFNAVRIPCAWSGYIVDQATYEISDSWLARVKEVVDYCVDNDMYAVLNIHWDGGWLENNPTYDSQVGVNVKQSALWHQIAEYFKDYDEHLLFAGTNEVGTGNTPVAENYTVQESFNQTFVVAVRATGGKNAYRNLIIQTYSTNIDYGTNTHTLQVAEDVVSNRLMVEVHYYDPWQFCGLEADASWGKMAYLWGADYQQYAVGTLSSRYATWGLEDWVVGQFSKVKAGFVDKGYPVILGEYGAVRRSSLTGSDLTHHLDSRAYYYKYVTEQAKKYGLVPFCWDNGYTGNLGFGIFYRTNGAVFDNQVLNALKEGASSGNYPF